MTPAQPPPVLPAAVRFEQSLPAGQWSTDAAVVERHRLDRSGWNPAGRPLGVAFARTVAEVQAVLRAAAATGVPITVRGAGTGLAGGAAAPADTVVLDLSRMNAIREISAADALAVVEPGVITADLDAAAASHGLCYTPDPASVAISTIGGNIATNAGGLRCAKYGVTRDSILALDVVLADSTLIHTGARTVKHMAGYDLTSLFVGSEGSLGIIVGATVRLRPLPAATATLTARFASIEAAGRAVQAISAAGVLPSVAELLDGPTLAAIDHAAIAAAPESLWSDSAGALLLLQTDGVGASGEADTIEAILAETATDVARADDPATAARLIATRRAALPALERLGRVLIEDIAVPRGALVEAFAGVAAIAEATGVRIFTLAHAFDGNLHPIIVTIRPHPASQPTPGTPASRSSGSPCASAAPSPANTASAS